MRKFHFQYGKIGLINYQKNYSKPRLKMTENITGDKCLLIDIADWHFNLAASMFTTGNEYNCKIAEELFFKIINKTIDDTKYYEFNQVVFCIGGDMLNIDNIKGTTTRGTAQDNDKHYYDAYESLSNIIIKAIDLIATTYQCNVEIIYVPGNHDEMTGFKLAKYVDAWYRNDMNIKVDYSPLPRKYFKYGKTLMCFAHNAKVNKLPSLIADEARSLWSTVDTVEVFLQHLHTEQVLFEENNMRIQRLPTISAKSKWTNDNCYNSKRQCKSFIFDYEDGLKNIIYTSIK